MRSGGNRKLRGQVLPTVVVVSVLMLLAMWGMCALWEQERLLFVRGMRLRQARADVESAYTLYRLHPDAQVWDAEGAYRLYDSLPQSGVCVRTQPWGLYEAVRVATADSVAGGCRLVGVEPKATHTLFYADGRSVVTLAGRSVLHGALRLPKNGISYGRVGSDFYAGPPIPRSAVGLSEPRPVPPSAGVLERIAAAFAQPAASLTPLPDSLYRSFLSDTTERLHVGDAVPGGCVWRGKIAVYADELRIDSTCRLEHVLVYARKITVSPGTRLCAQLFARDTVLVEPGAVLEYPSGIYAERYAALGERVEVDGYVIVRDTVQRQELRPNYRQARTARVRGLLWVDGVAHWQGIVAGRAVLRQAVYFSSGSYYEDVLYDVTLLENPLTAQPLWEASAGRRRKEAVCVD